MSGFHAPSSLAEALALLAGQPQARLLAGGSDLLVRLRHELPDVLEAPPLISLARLPELQGVRAEGEVLSIGACTSFAQIIASPLLSKHVPVLQAAARTVGAPAIRNMATLGGNLCTASPAGDSLPPLYVLDAQVELLSGSACRRMALADFILGPGKSCLAPGEILTRVLLPCRPVPARQGFEKVGRRQSLAIAVTSFAGLLRADASGRIAEARFAWGSVGPTVQRAPQAEAAIIGQPVASIDPEVLQLAVDTARAAVKPIDDLRASARYRRALAGNLLRRFLSRPAGAALGA